VSTSIFVVSQAAFSLSSSAFRSVKALATESRSPGTMPRAMSYSLYTTEQKEGQSRVPLEHDPNTKVGSRWSVYHLLLVSPLLV
jgi:hypothetical protein